MTYIMIRTIVPASTSLAQLEDLENLEEPFRKDFEQKKSWEDTTPT